MGFPKVSRWTKLEIILGFPGGSDYKESTSNVGDLGSIPGLGRSPGGGHGSPLQYSCPENPHGQKSLVEYSPLGPSQTWLWWIKLEFNNKMHAKPPNIWALNYAMDQRRNYKHTKRFEIRYWKYNILKKIYVIHTMKSWKGEKTFLLFIS